VGFHALQSLTSQVPVTVANAGLLVWLIRNIVREEFTSSFWAYLVFAAALNLAYLVTSLVALSRAYKGNFFYFPIFGRWAFDRWYGPNAPADGGSAPRPNRPPS